MEEYLESALPIDLVLFMFHFAHHLLVRQPEQDMEVVMPLASGAQFETKDKWRKLIDKLDIQHFHEKCEVDNATQMKNMSHTTENFFLQLRIAPFAQYTQYEYEFELNDQRGVLSVMLSKNSLLPPDLPGHIANKVYQVNFENMENGAGKVFFALVNSYSELEMTYVSESFTDYLIQYTGVALEYGEVPRQGSYGVNDLVVPLPRDQKPRQSILLPQPIDWDIGSYFPTYFTQEPDNSGLFLFDAIDRHYNLKKIRQSPVPTFDNPTGIPFEHPPLELFGGMKNMNWKPYHDLLATRYPISTLNRLIDFGSGRRPIRHEVEFNQDIYDLLPHMAQEWIASTQCKYALMTDLRSSKTVAKIFSTATIDTSRLVSEADIEQIGQKTMKLRELFQLHQQYLPICLYYRNFMSGLEYIETEKYFQDHLNGVNIGIPKYSSQDLDIISDRLNYQLTFLTGYIERLPLRSSLLKISNKYLNNSFAVTWKHL
ncbi:hypothetical protein BGW37DRAFT_487889, partial [Umbelopsis sp. PMI_123]